MKTVSALFDSLSEAHLSLQDLVEHGFNRQDINLVANAGDSDYSSYFNEAGQMHDTTENVTEAGTAIGGLGGLVVGLSFFFVPGVGPVLAAGGLLASVISGVGLGAIAGGVLGTLTALGLPAEHLDTYAEGIRRGGTLVVVQSADELVPQAQAVLDQHRPVNLETRAATWRQAGWAKYDTEAAPYTREQIVAERQAYVPTPIAKATQMI